MRLEELIRTLPGFDPYREAQGYRFDAELAQRACDFYPRFLRHVKGRRWAGHRFQLTPAQRAVTANLHGWVDCETGLRRFRELLFYVAKKNGKTAWGAGQVLYCLTCDGEPGAEIYSAAYCKEQASLVFFVAAGMVEQEPRLTKRLRCYGTSGASVARSIVYPARKSFYRPLASDTDALDGPDVHLAMIDELHRHKSPEMARILEKGTAARDQPLVIYLTTADHRRPSLCNDLVKKAEDVCSGRISDPRFLPAIWRASEDDDWRDPATWRKANPNLGVTVSEEFLARECQKAVENAILVPGFQRFHCNITTASESALIPDLDWQACRGPWAGRPRAELEKYLEGREAWAGLDLGDTDDITALALIVPAEGQLHVLPWFWVPHDTVQRREEATGFPYSAWIRQGWIDEVPGRRTDYDRVRAAIGEIGKRFGVRQIAYDPCQAVQLATQLDGDGFEMVRFAQSFLNYTGAVKAFLDKLATGSLLHGGNPVLDWMAGNAMGEYDSQERVRPSRQKSSEKIDGIVASLMALAQWQLQAGEPRQSQYEHEDPITCDF